jgi:putative transposase
MNSEPTTYPGYRFPAEIIRSTRCSCASVARWIASGAPLTRRGGARRPGAGPPEHHAAKRFVKCLLSGVKYKPQGSVTNGLRSYAVAKREVLPRVRHRTSRYLNNRAENSHRPTRRRERQMQRFRSAEQAQRFLAAHAMIYSQFRPRRHMMTADRHSQMRDKAFRIWRQEACAQTAA